MTCLEWLLGAAACAIKLDPRSINYIGRLPAAVLVTPRRVEMAIEFSPARLRYESVHEEMCQDLETFMGWYERIFWPDKEG